MHLLGAILLAGKGPLHTADALIYGEVMVGGHGPGQGAWQLSGPTGLALTPNGDLLVADTDNHRVQLCGGPVCTTVAGGHWKGPGANQLYRPYAAIASSGMQVFVADTHNWRIQLWEPEASSGISIIEKKSAEGLHDPMGIILDEGRDNLYVVDVGKHRILRFGLQSDGSVVPNSGLTVAGVSGESGNDTERLDNPTDAFLDMNGSLWISDARNNRIVRWPNASGNTSATSGVEEVTDLQGRPYGVYVAHDHVYYSDADACAVFKSPIINGRVGGVNATMAGGYGCGGSLRQLNFPTRIIVTSEGDLIVSDTANDRVIGFKPNPEPAAQVCTLSYPCIVDLDNGNPVSSNMLVLIDGGSGSSCGGPCLSAGFSGDDFANYSWPVYLGLRNSRFHFGSPKVGIRGNHYLLCWGANPDLQEFMKGDCSTFYFTVGKLTLEPVVYEDFHGENTQCVKGALCRINITAYGMPPTSMLSSPPESKGITGGSRARQAPLCGTSLENNFLGYRDALGLNPAIPLGWYHPYKDQGNATTWLAYDFGVALGMGRLPLCLCLEGEDCYLPFKFRYHAGTLRIRSCIGNQVFKCHEGQQCNVSVYGNFLQMDDTVKVINVRGYCGDFRWPMITGSFEYLNVSAAEVRLVEGDSADGADAVFGLGLSKLQGRFQLCYCASYDGKDGDDTPCNSVEEFTQSAGVIQVYRTDEALYRCILDVICFITVNGSWLAHTDRLIATLGGPAVCGITPPVPIWTSGGNLFEPTNFVRINGVFEPINGTENSTEFNLSAFDIPGIYQACYCSSWDSRDDETCDTDIEYYQVVGPIIVRGPLEKVLICTAELECKVVIQGTELTMFDRLRICAGGTGTCRNTPCIPPAENFSIYAPSRVDEFKAEFTLGVLPAGIFRLCYCSTGIFANASEAAACLEPKNMVMKAAELRVRGVIKDRQYSCVAESACTLIIPGYELRGSDYLMIVPVESVCGHAEAVDSSFFDPSGVLRAKQGTISREWRQFEFNYTTEAGHFRICYCVQLDCSQASSYHLNAGLLFVKGFIMNSVASYCLFGKICKLHVRGYGLREINDTVQVLAVANQCGGVQVLVDGDDNITGRLNGTYRKGSGLWDERVWYKNEHGQHLFYDVFAQRWVLGPRKEYEFPDDVGWAWAPGRLAMTPDAVTTTWVIWDPTAAMPGQQFLGAWVPSSLRVHRSTAQGTFENNPSDISTDGVRDTVLGSPYVLGVQFQLGRPRELGVYRICYCASTELGDSDETMCSSDDEFLASFQLLVVHIVRGGERYHCPLLLPCIVRTVLLGGFYPTLLSAALLPGGSQCHLVSTNPNERSALTKEFLGQLIEGEAVFDLGAQSTEGSFEVCLCTKNVGRNVSKEDFFQHAGTLTVAPVLRMEFGYAQETMFNLTRGSGLAQTDKLRIIPGDSCDVPESSMKSSTPHEVDIASGAWATYAIAGDGSTNRPGGLYTACLCSTWDGADPDEISCNSWNEFHTRVGTIVITTVQGPTLVSIASSVLHLVLMVFDTGARMLSEIRRMQALEILRNAVFASDLANVIEEAIAVVLGRETSAVSVSVVDLVSLPLSSAQRETAPSGTSAVGVRVLFNISLSGSEEQLVAPGCEVDFESSSAVPRDCFILATALDGNNSQRLLAELQSRLSTLSTPGVKSITALQMEELSALGFKLERPPVICSWGRTCDAEIKVTAPLSGKHGLLVIDYLNSEGAPSACGPTVAWPGTAIASSRAAAGFPKNPIRADGTGQLKHTFGLGVPQLPGRFTICFCRTDGVGLSNPPGDLAPCVQNVDFFSTAGTLTVRGPWSGQVFMCRLSSPCLIAIAGVGLTAWDRVNVVNSSGTCGGKRSNIGIEHNPALTTTVASSSIAQQTFNLGVISAIGTWKVCYCTQPADDASSTAACVSDADFVAAAGIVAARGANISAASLSCAKFDDRQSPSCSFQITGFGLWPGYDAVVLSDIIDADCRVAASVPTLGVRFNRNVLEAGEMENDMGLARTEAQYVSVGRWKLLYPERAGTYRICFCTAISQRGACASAMDFAHDIGLLVVRGAVGGDVFSCTEGSACEFKVTGYGLSLNDWVMLVSPSEDCGKGRLRYDAPERNPAPSVSASKDGSHASFNLGVLRPDERGQPSTALVCYCAGEDEDGDGLICENATEFTHPAGYFNTVICPPPLNESTFFPPVEDVFGDPGEPQVQLFSKPVWICTKDGTADVVSRQSIALPTDETIQLNDTMYITTDPERCHPRMVASLARGNMIASSVVDAKLFSADGRGQQSALLSHRLVLQRQARVNNSQQSFTCPIMEVQLVPFACGWNAALMFGLLLHAAPIAAIICAYTRHRMLVVLKSFWNLNRKRDLKRKVQMHFAKQNNAQVPFRLARAPTSVTFPGLGSMFGRSPSWSNSEMEKEPTTAAEKTPDHKLWPSMDSNFIDILASRRTAIVFIVVRLLAILLQVLLMFVAGSPGGNVLLIVVPLLFAFMAIAVQFAMAWAGNGLAGVHAAAAIRPIMLSLISLAKMHFDLWLPLLARQHHCEAWRVALVLCVVLVILQVVWPIGSLILSLRPSSRIVSQKALYYTMAELDRHVKPPIFFDNLEHQGHQPKKKKSSVSRDWAPMFTGQSQQWQPQQSVLSRAHKNSKFNLQVAQKRPAAKRLSAKMRRCCGWLIALCKKARHAAGEVAKAACISSWARVLVFTSPSISAPSELERNGRLAAMWIFMEASGWHIASAVVCDAAERALNVNLTIAAPRSMVIHLLAGGFDLTALHTFVVIGYVSRMSAIEITTLIIAAIVGVLQLSITGLWNTILDIAVDHITGPPTLIAAALAVTLMRLLVFSPLAAGCPFYTWEFVLCALSVLVVEAPVIAICAWYRHRRLKKAHGEKQSEGLKGVPLDARIGSNLAITASVEPAPPTSPPPRLPDIPAVTNRKDSKNLEGAQRRPSLSSSSCSDLAANEEDPHAEMCHLADKLKQQLATKVPKTVHSQSDIEALKTKSIILSRLMVELLCVQGISDRVQRLTQLYEIILQIDELLNAIDAEKESMLVASLRGLIDEDIDRTWCIYEAASLVRTYHFRCGSFSSRDKIAKAYLPGIPEFWLIHWAELQERQTLPERAETERMVPADMAFQCHGENLVVVVVIDCVADPKGSDERTVRQLINFAQWYQRRWGRHTEPHFWLGRICLPKIKPHAKSKKAITAALINEQGFEASTPLSRTSSKLRSSSKRESINESAEIIRRSSSKDSTGVHSNSGRFSLPDLTSGSRMMYRTDLGNSAEFSASEGPQLVTEEASDAFLPLVFGASDVVLVCNPSDCEGSAWARVELSLARTFAPASRIYSVDFKFADLRKDPADQSRSSGIAGTIALGMPMSAPIWGSPTLSTTPSTTIGMPDVGSEQKSLPPKDSPPLMRSPSPIGSPPLPGTPGIDSISALPEFEEVNHESAIQEYPSEVDPTSTVDTLFGVPFNERQLTFQASPTMVTHIDEFDWDMFTPEEIESTAKQGMQYDLWCLLDPTDWNCAATNVEHDRARIRCLACACWSEPLILPGGFRSQCNSFDGETTFTVFKLEKKKKKGRRAVMMRGESIASFDDDQEEEVEPTPESLALSYEESMVALEVAREKKYHRKELEKRAGREERRHREQRMIYERPVRTWGHDNASELYLTVNPLKRIWKATESKFNFPPVDEAKLLERELARPKSSTLRLGADLGGEVRHSPNVLACKEQPDSMYSDTLIRRAAIAKSSEPTTEIPPLPPLKVLVGPDHFHPLFHASMVTITPDGLAAEQLQYFLAQRGDARAPGLPQGGSAITLRPLRVRTGVLRESPKALGVRLKVTIDALDTRWNDGFAIGFTAQNPDEWPERKAKPRHGRQLPQAWMCGYRGYWDLEGRSDLIRPLTAQSPPWQPDSLRSGDVVTAVVSAPPTSIFRLLVNDQVVAERKGSSELPNPETKPLWGVVDVDGRCLRVCLMADTNPVAGIASQENTGSSSGAPQQRATAGSRGGSPQQGGRDKHGPPTRPLLPGARTRSASSTSRRRPPSDGSPSNMLL